MRKCVICVRVTLVLPTKAEFESYYLLMPSEDDIYKSRLPIKHLQKSGLPLFQLVVGVQQLDALILLPQRFNSFQILSLRPAFFSPNDLADLHNCTVHIYYRECCILCRISCRQGEFLSSILSLGPFCQCCSPP